MSLSRIIVPAIAIIGGALAVGGCTVTATPAPAYATTEVTAAPVANIETYPSAQYEGHPVYLYNDHWYYRNGSRWTYYNSEPPELNRQRQYVQHAPPAHPGYAPPAPQAEPRYNNGPSEAPPAVRVQ